MKQAITSSLEQWLIHIFLGAGALIMLYPILMMVLSGFKTNPEIFSTPFSLPNSFNLDNFKVIWNETDVPRYFLNSIIVTLLSVIFLLTTGTMAAYAIARYRFSGSLMVSLFFLSGLMLPLRLAIIPLFIQLKYLGLVDSLVGLICIYTAMSLPATVFILTGFLRTLPKDLEDSARIDGASELRIMIQIMVPLISPALVIAGIYNAVPIWNDFFFPLIFIQSPEWKTLAQGLTAFFGEYSINYGVLYAGLTLAALPMIVIFIVQSRRFIAGMTAGAIK
ncbi:putative ABC-type sugar transport system,permease component [Vibrio nigripulchritudo SFn27]|uniref:Putative ABC-type sugar transport system, permease component n=1 Tax=Vibrio nigripulchritudo TaxID=28173 RepID=U4KAT1_9VIBR|nr:carbohydrate ABC transporter permease [Vibrio nigripulchritudo]CCN81110.1 putative ABC-type sugar transport system,permease component [Vibrio nigripulchritudo BLFn1]CCN86562.1 putative ABC-type sugar transport system,permease component [Vibrio nigripulchritudo SFn27]CCN92863.1 putative ABC-type sugar transport system,permease component [Vibrio nigripulchritudo ENn2]CCO40178.1 putative ABC-type sugar transport system,permease component [Vibrio nigripulchritudo SFn135]CCO52357.1 putative ABC-